MTELTTHDSPKVRLFVVPRLTRSIAPLRSAKTRRHSAAEPLAGPKLPPLAAAAARSNVYPAQSQQNYGFVSFAVIK